jgi:hypothetical protein
MLAAAMVTSTEAEAGSVLSPQWFAPRMSVKRPRTVVNPGA